MKKLKEINSKTLYEKDPYLVEICAGGAEYKDMGIAFTDYDKVADYIINAFCNEGIHDLDAYADFRFYLLSVLENHGINGSNRLLHHFETALKAAADRNETLGKYEKQYVAHQDRHLLGRDEDLKPHMEIGLNLFLFIVFYVITGAIIFIPAWFLVYEITEKMGLELSDSTITFSIMTIYAIPWLIFYIWYEIEDYKEVKYQRSTTRKQQEIDKKRNARIKKQTEFLSDTLDFIRVSFWMAIIIAMAGFTVWQIAKIFSFI